MKVTCPGCGAEVDTETGAATFPPGSDPEGEEGGDDDGELSPDPSETADPVPPAAPAPARRSRFLKG